MSDSTDGAVTYLPVEQGVACWAALRRQANGVKACGDGQSRSQIMADLLVERLTGQARAEDVNVELQLMMPLGSLLESRLEQAAQLAGSGPLPGPLAREDSAQLERPAVVASAGHPTHRRRWLGGRRH